MNAALLGTCIALMVVQFLAYVPWASTVKLIARGAVTVVCTVNLPGYG